jgi:hypothetical protein
MHYLAELPWVPQAVAGNRELDWRETGERFLEVASQVGPARAVVRLELDEAGDIVRATGTRPRRGSGGGGDLVGPPGRPLRLLARPGDAGRGD